MKSEKEFDSVRESIVEVSREIFRRYGLSKVSMDDISKASGKSRSTLYHYFKNKKEVFEALAVKEFAGLISDGSKPLKKEHPISKNLLLYNKTKLAKIKELIQEYSNIFEDLRNETEIFVRLTKLLVEEDAAVYGKMLNWGIDKGEIADLEQEDITFLSNVLVTAFRSFEQEILLNDQKKDIENRLEWLINILCKGLK